MLAWYNEPVLAEDYTWQNVTIGGGGFVSSVIAAPNDENIFYARTDVGGAYRWDEGTQTWIPLLDWVSSDQKGYLGVDGIAVDPGVPGRVYMLVGIGYLDDGKSAFVRSDDYGSTWEQFDITNTFKAHGNGMGRSNGERLAVDPNNSNIILAGTRYNGLWKSTDRGASWTRLSLDYTPDIDRGIHESGVCVVVFDKASASTSGGTTQTIYAGVSRETDNVYVSHDAGASWSSLAGQPTTASIRPQRMALTSDGRYLYITYGNGGGPHPMLWSGVTDYYNRGAIYKYDTQENTWTDISPENFMQDLDYIAEGDDQVHYGAYSGISIDPNNEDRIIATSINSWRAPQFWDIDGTWKDAWGDNIYLSEDGGETWREMFRYYWMDGGYYPDYDMVDENGYPWIVGEAIHWNAAVAIDPFDSNRAFVCSGNGVFSTDNLLDSYTTTDWVDDVETTVTHGRATWKFTSNGIEETVPLGMVSSPQGPLVSVIGDYDGFIHEDLDVPSPYGRLSTVINGQETHLGTTTSVDVAAQNPKALAKAGVNSVDVNNQTVSICGVTLSDDGGTTWNQIYTEPTGVSVTPAEGTFFKGNVAVSADGSVVLWSPMSMQTDSGSVSEAYHPELFYYKNSSWTKCQGIEFSSHPAADPENANVFYAYNPEDGYLYVSRDQGATFTQEGLAGTSDYKTIRLAPGIEGDVWIPLGDGGLTRSTDQGDTFNRLADVSWCEAVGFGKAIDNADYPTVYIYGTVDSVTGVFRSTNQGAGWLRVNDDAHTYGGPGDGHIVIGDMNVFGRVYMSTAGRGIVYGEPADGSISDDTNDHSDDDANDDSPDDTTDDTTDDTASDDTTGDTTDDTTDDADDTQGMLYQVDYATNEWNKGFTAQVTITNNSSQDIEGWTLAWTFADGQVISGSWNADISQSGAEAAASNEAGHWNGTISANGGSVSFGFQAAYSSVNSIPVDFTLNGVSCNEDPVESSESEDGAGTDDTDAAAQDDTESDTDSNVGTRDTGIIPNQIISRGKPAYSSNGDASTLVDNIFGYGVFSISNGSWVAIEVGAGPSDVFVAWNTPPYSWSDVIAASTSCQQGVAIPIDYTIETSSNSTNGSDGDWTTAKTITENTVTNRGHVIPFEGASWVRISISNGTGSFDEVEVFDLSDGGTDSWFFPGTSISANAFKGSVPDNNFADVVAENHPGFTPIMIRGGIPCINSTSFAEDIKLYLEMAGNVKYWAIEMGTNDAWGGSNNNAETFRANMQIVIDACKENGIEPIIARMIGTNEDAAGWQVHPDYLAAIDELTQENDLIAGPDFYTWFSTHPEDLTSDGVHPSESGSESMQRLWAEKMASLYTGSEIPDTELDKFTLTVNIVGAGNVVLSPIGGTYQEGTEVTLTAQTLNGSEFLGWSGDASGTDAKITIVMDSDKEVTAEFSSSSSTGCESYTEIDLPFAQDGTGEYCWFTTDDIAYVNSWNMVAVEINGIDYTNMWSNTMPAKQDGGYYIYYSGSYAWSHFEATASN